MTSVLLTYNPHFGAFHKSRTDECQKRVRGFIRLICVPSELVCVSVTMVSTRRAKHTQAHDAKRLKRSIPAQAKA